MPACARGPWSWARAQPDGARGLLLVGDVYPEGAQRSKFWWGPNTTRNEYPAFFADAVRPGWRREELYPTTMCSEVGTERFVPVIDAQGAGGRRDRWCGGTSSSFARLAESEVGAHRGQAGSMLSCVMLYYSAYSLSSFSHVVNRAAQLQQLRHKDSWTSGKRLPRFDEAPLVLVELNGADVPRPEGATIGRAVPCEAGAELARTLSCPFVCGKVDIGEAALEAMGLECARMGRTARLG